MSYWEWKKSKSAKLELYIRSTYGLDYPVLDHCEYFRGKNKEWILVSHSYGFCFKYHMGGINRMIEDGFTITFDPYSTYSSDTFSVIIKCPYTKLMTK